MSLLCSDVAVDVLLIKAADGFDEQLHFIRWQRTTIVLEMPNARSPFELMQVGRYVTPAESTDIAVLVSLSKTCSPDPARQGQPLSLPGLSVTKTHMQSGNGSCSSGQASTLAKYDRR
jgi:hypothetical protein